MTGGLCALDLEICTALSIPKTMYINAILGMQWQPSKVSKHSSPRLQACCTHIAQAQFQCRTHRHLYNAICSASPDKQARQRLQGSAPGEERRKPLITGILSASSRSGISSPTYPAFSLSIICSHTHSMIVFNLYIKLSLTSNTSTGSFSFSRVHVSVERAYKEMVQSKQCWMASPALTCLSLQPATLISFLQLLQILRKIVAVL